MIETLRTLCKVFFTKISNQEEIWESYDAFDEPQQTDEVYQVNFSELCH